MLCHAIPFASIQDNMYPYLVLGSEPAVVPWERGSLALLRDRFRFLRVNIRGVQFSNHVPISGWERGWQRLPCEQADGGLCQYSDSGGGQLLFFPTGEVDVPDDWQRMASNEYVRQIQATDACQTDKAMRAVRVNDTRYEVSLCDLVDLNLDFVYDNWTRSIHWRLDPSSLVELVLVSLLAVLFVSALSQNLIRIFARKADEEDGEGDPGRLQLGLVAVTWLYTAIFFLGLQPETLVFQEDAALVLQLMLFVLVEVAGQMLLAQLPNKKAPEQEAYVSILTASLLLLSCRVHSTFANPYLLFLTIIFGTRSFYKLFRVVDMDMSGNEFVVHIVLQLVDFYVFCSILGNGVQSASGDAYEGAVTTQLLVFVSLLAGGLLWTVKKPQSHTLVSRVEEHTP